MRLVKWKKRMIKMSTPKGYKKLFKNINWKDKGEKEAFFNH